MNLLLVSLMIITDGAYIVTASLFRWSTWVTYAAIGVDCFLTGVLFAYVLLRRVRS